MNTIRLVITTILLLTSIPVSSVFSYGNYEASNDREGESPISNFHRFTIEHTAIDSMSSGASELDPARSVLRVAQDPIVANVLGVDEVASAAPAEVLREDLVSENVDVFAVDVAIDPRSDREEVALIIGDDSMVSKASNPDRAGRQFSKRIVVTKRKLEQTCTGGSDAFDADDGGYQGVLYEAVRNYTSLVNFNKYGSPLNCWKVGAVTSFLGLFYNMETFNEEVSSWETGKVTRMDQMFNLAQAFNQPIQSWNTGKVTSMENMFMKAKAFNQPLSSWNTGKVTSMEHMFNLAENFNQDLCSWGQNYDASTLYQFMFKATACPTKQKPSSNEGPWCSQSSQADCPKPSISTDVWRIVFTGLDANFTAISDTELSLKYDIGKNPPSNGSADGRYETKLYEKDCSTELPTSGAGPLLFNLTDNGRITKSPANNTFDEIKVMYNVNKTAIATSSVWNSTAKEIEVCQVIQLIEASTTLGEMVIVEAKRVVSIEFDLDVNISLGVDLGEGIVDLSSGNTGVDDYVTAYKCDENFNQDNSPLVPNEKLLVCIESNSTDVEIKEIETMTLKQVGVVLNLPIIVNSIISSPQITGNTVVSSIKQVVSTRVPINVFNFANDQSIDVEGKVVMQLDGSSARRLQANSGTEGGKAAAFSVRVTLQPKAALVDGVELHSSASIAGGAFISLSVVLALVAW